MRLSLVVLFALASAFALVGCASTNDTYKRTNSPSVTTPLYEGKRVLDRSLVIAGLPDTLRTGPLMTEPEGFHDALLATFADTLRATSTLNEVVVSQHRPATTEVPLHLTRSHTARTYSMPQSAEPLAFDSVVPDFVLLFAEATTGTGYGSAQQGGVTQGATQAVPVVATAPGSSPTAPVLDPAGFGLGYPVAEVTLRYLLWDNQEMRTVGYGLVYLLESFPASENGAEEDEQMEQWRLMVGAAAREFAADTPFRK